MTLSTPTIREAKAIIRAHNKARRLAAPKPETRKLDHKRVVPVGPGQRQPRERAPEHLAFIRRLPCVICTLHGEHPKASQAAHVRAGYADAGWRPTGMQEKPSDYRCVPLCAGHHVDGPKAQHRSGERAWWEAHGIYPPDLCADLKAAAPDAERGAVVIQQHCIRAMSAALREARKA